MVRTYNPPPVYVDVWMQETHKDPPSMRRRYEQLEMDGDEDDADLVEQAAHHDRAWDDWKADNPRGSGNKANKII